MGFFHGRPHSDAISKKISASTKYSISTLMEESYLVENAIIIRKSVYNGSIHSTTLFLPNLLHFGRERSLYLALMANYVINVTSIKVSNLIT